MPQQSEATVNPGPRDRATHTPVTHDPATHDPATHDLVIRRAHVFDGHRALDGLYDIGVDGTEITAVSAEPLRGGTEVDAAGGGSCPA